MHLDLYLWAIVGGSGHNKFFPGVFKVNAENSHDSLIVLNRNIWGHCWGICFSWSFDCSLSLTDKGRLFHLYPSASLSLNLNGDVQ